MAPCKQLDEWLAHTGWYPTMNIGLGVFPGKFRRSWWAVVACLSSRCGSADGGRYQQWMDLCVAPRQGAVHLANCRFVLQWA